MVLKYFADSYELTFFIATWSFWWAKATWFIGIHKQFVLYCRLKKYYKFFIMFSHGNISQLIQIDLILLLCISVYLWVYLYSLNPAWLTMSHVPSGFAAVSHKQLHPCSKHRSWLSDPKPFVPKANIVDFSLHRWAHIAISAVAAVVW